MTRRDHILAHPEATFIADPVRGVLFGKNPKAAGTSVARRIMRGGIDSKRQPERFRAWLYGHDPDLRAVTVFTLVRCPFARMESLWRYMHQKRKFFGSFEAFVRGGYAETRLIREHAIAQSVFTHLGDGRRFADVILRVEGIGQTWGPFADAHGYPSTLPRTNSTKPKQPGTHYTPGLLREVARIYARDIEVLGCGACVCEKGAVCSMIGPASAPDISLLQR